VLLDTLGKGWLGKPGKPRCGCGVAVPGAPRGKEWLVAGLLLADDLEGNGSTLQGTRSLAQLVSGWCYGWEVVVGISKCGVVCVGHGGGLRRKRTSYTSRLKRTYPS